MDRSTLDSQLQLMILIFSLCVWMEQSFPHLQTHSTDELLEECEHPRYEYVLFFVGHSPDSRFFESHAGGYQTGEELAGEVGPTPPT